MQSWRWIALSVTVSACSGGFDPVSTVGGDAEYEGPGAGDPYGQVGDKPGASTSIPTLLGVCMTACAHVHAADCESAPKHATDACEATCIDAIASTVPGCADEAAALYTCTTGATVSCSMDVEEAPQVAGCDAETAALSNCVMPGGACARAPEGDALCDSLGLNQAFLCNENVGPPGCTQVSQSVFCCP